MPPSGPGSCIAGLVGLDCVQHSDCDDPGPPAVAGVCQWLDHFKCYEAIPTPGFANPVLPSDVGLEDQFGIELVDVEYPRYWCDPVNKTVVASPDPAEIGNVYPIGTAVHLACYDIGPPMVVDELHFFRDQIFGVVAEEPLLVEDSELLLLPFRPGMREWVDGVTNTAIPPHELAERKWH